jgi:hypothetical protein
LIIEKYCANEISGDARLFSELVALHCLAHANLASELA